MGIRFDFINEGATIAHLNIRKDSADDDRVTAIDVKLTGLVENGDWLQELFCPDADDRTFTFHLSDLLWIDNDDKDVRFFGIDIIKSHRAFKQCTVDYGGLRLHGDTKKFSFRPVAGGLVDLTFSIAVKEPEARTISTLAEMVQEASQCSVFGADLLDDLDVTASIGANTEQNGSFQFNPIPNDDPLYIHAVELVVNHQRPLISFLQKELGTGYNRAARLIERMEQDLIVSEPDGTGARVCFRKPGDSAALTPDKARGDPGPIQIRRRAP